MTLLISRIPASEEFLSEFLSPRHLSSSGSYPLDLCGLGDSTCSNDTNNLFLRITGNRTLPHHGKVEIPPRWFLLRIIQRHSWIVGDGSLKSALQGTKKQRYRHLRSRVQQKRMVDVWLISDKTKYPVVTALNVLPLPALMFVSYKRKLVNRVIEVFEFYEVLMAVGTQLFGILRCDTAWSDIRVLRLCELIPTVLFVFWLQREPLATATEASDPGAGRNIGPARHLGCFLQGWDILCDTTHYMTRNDLTFWAHSQICEKRLLASLCLSVRPSAKNYSAPTGGILNRFDIWEIFENLSRKFNFH